MEHFLSQSAENILSWDFEKSSRKACLIGECFTAFIIENEFYGCVRTPLLAILILCIFYCFLEARLRFLAGLDGELAFLLLNLVLDHC